MKKLLFLIPLLIYVFIGCTKDIEKDVEEEVIAQNIIDDSSYVKFINPPPTSITMPKYVTIPFKIAYHISSEVLPYSGDGFKLTNIILIDNDQYYTVWSSKKLRFRTDTLEFIYDSKNYLPKSKIIFKSHTLQLSSATTGYVIAESDSLIYSISSN
jgi:hypothetical protein